MLGITGRQTSSVQKSHKSDKKLKADADPKDIFGAKKSCVLSPQATEGPFCTRSPKLHARLHGK